MYNVIIFCISGGYFMKRKIISTFLLSAFLSVSCFVSTVSADTGRGVGFSYYVYQSGAVVDGSKNGQFYSLKSGDVSLVVDSTSAYTKGPAIGVSLRRSRLGFDKEYSTIIINGTGTYQFGKVDTNSSKYYLYAFGSGKVGTYQYVDGKLHNHR